MFYLVEREKKARQLRKREPQIINASRTYLIPHSTKHHTLYSHRLEIGCKLRSLLVLLDLLREPSDVLDASEVARLVHALDGEHDVGRRDLLRVAEVVKHSGRVGVEADTGAEQLELGGVGGVGDGRVGEDGVGLEEGGFERSLGGRGEVKGVSWETGWCGKPNAKGGVKGRRDEREQERAEQRGAAAGGRCGRQQRVPRCLCGRNLLRTSECCLGPTAKAKRKQVSEPLRRVEERKESGQTSRPSQQSLN